MATVVFVNGMPGSGKSTFGKKLAKVLDYDFFDLDNYITSKTSLSPADWINQHGEEQFRLVESEYLKHFLNKNGIVLSCGGGTPCFHSNLDMMLESGLCLYLNMSPKALYSRLSQKKGVESRPLLQLNEKEMPQYLEKLLAEREVFYNQMQLTLDGLNPDSNLVKAYLASFQGA
ncbi:MAG: shikimate kinase [Bacteroidia bacterium]